MNQVNCSVCGKKCVKSGKIKVGSQRWFCKECKTSLTHAKKWRYFDDLASKVEHM